MSSTLWCVLLVLFTNTIASCSPNQSLRCREFHSHSPRSHHSHNRRRASPLPPPPRFHAAPTSKFSFSQLCNLYFPRRTPGRLFHVIRRQERQYTILRGLFAHPFQYITHPVFRPLTTAMGFILFTLHFHLLHHICCVAICIPWTLLT